MLEDTRTVQLRSNILKVLLLIFVLLGLSVMYVINIEQGKALDNFEKNTHEYIQKTAKHVFDDITKKYIIIAYRLIQNQNIASYVYNNDREGLYQVLKPRFEQLQKETKYFKTLHFIKANGVSFLRVHQKDKYDDPIINDRIMVQEIMKTQKTLIGYETGKYGTVFRVLVPVFYQGEFIGSLGIGIDPNYIIEVISSIVRHNGALFIKKDNLKLYKLDDKLDFSINQFELYSKLDEKSLDIVKSLPEDFHFKSNYIMGYKKDKYLFYTLDLKNFKDDIHGKLIFMNNITYKFHELKNTQLQIALIMVFFLIVIFIIIRSLIIKFGNELNKVYNAIISNTKKNETYLKAIDDNSSNIIITSSAAKNQIVSANRRFYEFSGFNSLEDFQEKYKCICELFVNKDGYLSKQMGELSWIEYILQNPQHTHKAIMKKGDKEVIFKVTSSQIAFEGQKMLVSTFVDITEIEEIKNRFSYAINGTQDGLWDWNLKTNEVYFSPRWKEMLGYEDNELPSSLDVWEEKVHPDDKQNAIDDIMANQHGKTKRYENIHRLKHKDGSWVWILDRGQTIFDAEGNPERMVGFHTDITKQKEEEKLIQLQARRGEALLELPNYAESLSEKEFIQKGREILETLTKSSVGFIYFVENDEKSLKPVTCSGDIQCSKETFDAQNRASIFTNAIASKKPFFVNDYLSYADRMKLENRDIGVQRLIGTPIVEDGKVVMIAGVGNKNTDYDSSDVETLMLLSNDIWRSVKTKRDTEEIKQKDKLMLSQSKNAAMGEMISMIAHQWRQPLAAIAMSANNILVDVELDMVDNESLKEGSKDILYQTTELSKTIDDFKEFFKPVKKSEFTSADATLDSALKVVGKSLENNNIKMVKNINTQKEIQTYSRELMQVFLNIINNAKDILVEKNIQNRRITVTIDEKEDHIVVAIADNAGGVPEDIIDKIFNPYFTTKNELNGTGLGLYMSKTIVEKHLGGILEVVNENDGACFTMRLPYNLPNEKKEA